VEKLRGEDPFSYAFWVEHNEHLRFSFITWKTT